MTNAESAPENRCSMCGGSEAHDSPEAQRRILELEGHVQELTQRAAVNGKSMPVSTIPGSQCECDSTSPW